MRSLIRLWLATLLLLWVQTSVFAEPDARMQINVLATEQGVEVRWLHANIRKAADLALPELWRRMIPQHAMDQIPKHVKAIRFLQKAVPNNLGVKITFSEKQVLNYLKQHQISYYAEQSADNTIIGSQTAPPMVDDGAHFPSVQAPLQAGLLRIQRQASLPEQVLFEEELARDPRVLSLSLSQVNKDRQQYRLQLKSPDDQWMMAWFSRRGMTLTQSVEGWLAR